MADYQVSAWLLSDFSGAFSDASNITDTQGNYAVGTSTTLGNGASIVTFLITDDDPYLHDAYVEPDSTLSTLTNDLLLGGITYSAGQNIEAEFVLQTTDDPPIRFIVGRIGAGQSNSGENLVVFATSPIAPNQTFTFAGVDDGWLEPYGTLCFAAGTMIDTVDGPVAVEHLRAGHTVLSHNNEPQEINWIGGKTLSAFELSQNPQLRPIRICKNALGENRPGRDLIVSPQHRILIDDWRAAYHFGEDEVLVAAKSLVNGKDVVIDDVQTGVEYYHILLNSHDLLIANGQPAESLFPGQEALETLTEAQRSEILTIKPEFFTTNSNSYKTIRRTIPHRAASALAA